MFKHFVISLIAVIAFAIFEYAHNKATYSIKTAWVKYLAALILGTFGFSYLTKWEPFQWIEQAGFVVAFLFFFWVILQKLNIKGVPGQAAKVVPFVLITAALASCSDQGKVTFTEVDTLHTKRDVPVFDAGGNRLPFNAPEKDTLITYEPSGEWKAGYAWHRGDTEIALGGLLVFLAGFYFLWYKPGNKGDDKPSGVPVLCAAILALGLIVGGTLDWARCNTTQTIDKSVYDQIKDRPDALDSLMDARLKH